MTEALEIDKGRWKESRNKRERDNQRKASRNRDGQKDIATKRKIRK